MTKLKRPKMLIIGTGFHKHIMKDCRSPLTCWVHLLKSVATAAKINVSHIDFSDPILAWEQLVMERTYGSTNNKTAYLAEKDLRSAASKILNLEAEKLLGAYIQSEIAINFKSFSGYILNLNFDHLLDISIGIHYRKSANIPISKIPQLASVHRRNAISLYRRWTLHGDNRGSVTVWHPHGSYSDASSIRLGMRDYGFQPACYASAFDAFKKWEREVIGCDVNSKTQTDAEYDKLLFALSQMDNLRNITFKPYDNWITRFMISDISFIGAGLSQSEIGLRWLLVQRQRNIARMKHSKNSLKTIYHSVNESIPNSLVDVDTSSNWKCSWEKALK